MLKITILVGNPKPQSRTLKLAETLVDELLVAGTYDLRVIDLAEYSSHIFQWPSPVMAELNQAVADSDLLVVATPPTRPPTPACSRASSTATRRTACAASPPSR